MYYLGNYFLNNFILISKKCDEIGILALDTINKKNRVLEESHTMHNEFR